MYDLTNCKEKFTNAVESQEVQKLLNEYGLKTGKINTPQSQYSGVVYWYNVEITETERKLKPIYRNDLWGFHIMPYCITKEDVKNAKRQEKGFNEQKGAVDFDPASGNIHKWPNVDKTRYQIVLIPKNKETGGKQRGPGFKQKPGKGLNFDTDINNEMYFPPIDSIDEWSDLKQDLLKSLQAAFDTIFEAQ